MIVHSFEYDDGTSILQIWVRGLYKDIVKNKLLNKTINKKVIMNQWTVIIIFFHKRKALALDSTTAETVAKMSWRQ